VGVFACIRAYIHTHTQTHTHTHTFIYIICVFAFVCACVCVCAYIQTVIFGILNNVIIKCKYVEFTAVKDHV
jgi:hypothetical protein